MLDSYVLGFFKTVSLDRRIYENLVWLPLPKKTTHPPLGAEFCKTLIEFLNYPGGSKPPGR